jgi:hypothetical protein
LRNLWAAAASGCMPNLKPPNLTHKTKRVGREPET